MENRLNRWADIVGWQKHRAVLAAVCQVRGLGIIESGLATHYEGYGSSNYRYHSHNFIRLFLLTFDGHKVRQFGHAFFRKESRNQDVCVRQVELTNRVSVSWGSI